MPESILHEHCVDGWLALAACAGTPPHLLIARLRLAVDALWKRCRDRLGEVALMAIADRVLHETRVRHPCFGDLRLDEKGIAFDGLGGPDRGAGLDAVRGAARFLLCEFLRIVGRLTAEVLSPALHAELARIDGGGAGAP